MHPHSRLFRLTAGTAIAALLLAPVMPSAALAQTPPPPAGATQQQPGDPPARVGRLAHTTGTVSFHSADADQWSPAQINYPVTSGDAFWTDPGGQAELQISDSRIQLAGGTAFTVDRLDEAGMQATQGEGEIYLRLRAIGPTEGWSVQTPRGLVTLAGDGRYAIVAGDTQTPTTVTVLEGDAQVTGPDLAMQVGPGQAAIITGTDTFQGSLAAAQPDAFVTAMLARERPPPVPGVAPPPVVTAMPGGADLAEYGTWTETPAYGPVWYPRVVAGWVPYRYGHWVWIWPWGWTWVDDAPWGFAPFHYGRWVLIGGAWAWTPGVIAVVSAPPVYAPALVTFFGLAAGVGLGAALAAGTVGWCPLGPREAYHPWYRASDHYWREVNVREVHDFRGVDRRVAIDRYVNRSAATVVPASVLQASRPVRPVARRVDPRALAAARPMIGREPVAPSRATFGVTGATARQTRLAPVPPGATVRRGAAPGPAIHPTAMPGAARPQVRPPLARPEQRIQPPQQARPRGAPGAPGQAAPALVTPGVRPQPASPGRAVRPQTASPERAAPSQPRLGGGPVGAPFTPHAPPLMQPGHRPPAATTPQRAPNASGGTAPRYQPPTGAPAARPAAPVRPQVTAPRPVPAPHVAPSVVSPSRPTPTYRPPPEQRAPSPAAPNVFRPPPAATPHYQPPARVAPPQETRPAPQRQFQAPQYHPAPAPQYHAPPPRPAPPPQFHPAPQRQFQAPPPRAAPAPAPHAPPQQQQDRQKRPDQR